MFCTWWAFAEKIHQIVHIGIQSSNFALIVLVLRCQFPLGCNKSMTKFLQVPLCIHRPSLRIEVIVFFKSQILLV